MAQEQHYQNVPQTPEQMQASIRATVVQIAALELEQRKKGVNERAYWSQDEKNACQTERNAWLDPKYTSIRMLQENIKLLKAHAKAIEEIVAPLEVLNGLSKEIETLKKKGQNVEPLYANDSIGAVDQKWSQKYYTITNTTAGTSDDEKRKGFLRKNLEKLVENGENARKEISSEQAKTPEALRAVVNEWLGYISILQLRYAHLTELGELTGYLLPKDKEPSQVNNHYDMPTDSASTQSRDYLDPVPSDSDYGSNGTPKNGKPESIYDDRNLIFRKDSASKNTSSSSVNGDIVYGDSVDVRTATSHLYSNDVVKNSLPAKVLNQPKIEKSKSCCTIL